MDQPEWQWNEMQQVGADYADPAMVEEYDQRMSSFRDIEGENQDMLRMLNLPAGSSILEIGCGTGRFSRAAAAAGMNVSAADVSKMMLQYLKQKVEAEKLPAITTQNAGFLTMDFPNESFDAVVSGVALHHLPDVWKLVALQNIFRVLKKGGQFILRDVIFTLKDGETPHQCFERFIQGFNELIRSGAIRHVKQEFSTFGWIMDEMLIRAGFTINSCDVATDSFIIYHCQK